MKRIIISLFSLLFLFSFFVVAEEGAYGSGNYSSGKYGLANTAETEVVDNINITTNETVSVDTSNTTDTLIDLNVNNNLSGVKIVVVKSTVPPTNSTTPISKKSISKFITIEPDINIVNGLTYSIIKVKYLDSEVNGIDESTLRLSRWNGTTWVIFDGIGKGWVDIVQNIIYANTTQFSTWGVFGSETTSSNDGGSSSGSGSTGTSGGSATASIEGNKTYTLFMLLNTYSSLKVEGMWYRGKITHIDIEDVVLLINDIEMNLSLNQPQNLDINKDGKEDITIMLSKITGKFVFLKVKDIVTEKNIIPVVNESIEETIKPSIGDLNQNEEEMLIPFDEDDEQVKDKEPNMLLFFILAILLVVIVVLITLIFLKRGRGVSDDGKEGNNGNFGGERSQ